MNQNADSGVYSPVVAGRWSRSVAEFVVHAKRRFGPEAMAVAEHPRPTSEQTSRGRPPAIAINHAETKHLSRGRRWHTLWPSTSGRPATRRRLPP